MSLQRKSVARAHAKWALVPSLFPPREVVKNLGGKLLPQRVRASPAPPRGEAVRPPHALLDRSRELRPSTSFIASALMHMHTPGVHKQLEARMKELLKRTAGRCAALPLIRSVFEGRVTAKICGNDGKGLHTLHHNFISCVH